MTTFVIVRTSTLGGEKPCEEAYQGKYLEIDAAWSFLEEKTIQAWFSKGINHRTVEGVAYRDFERDGWLIDVNTLDDLLALVKCYGKFVIDVLYTNPPTLEIYDYYRE